MKHIYFIGDLHGNFKGVRDLVERCPRISRNKNKYYHKNILVCLGDFGGNYFGNYRDDEFKSKLERYPFDAYFVGLLLTDGYVLSDRDGLGLDMTDEDVISFVAKTIGADYKSYNDGIHKTRYRVLITIPGISKQVERFGIVPNKSTILPTPKLLDEEKQFLPYIIRGIIDGDGCVSKTSYGGAQFYICTMSKDFAMWITEVLKNNFFMDDIAIRISESGLYRIETANQYNILKLIAIVYNKPFGMNRKYNYLRKTFRDYNSDALLDKDDGIVQTTTI